jgi:flagellar motor protein MotB
MRGSGRRLFCAAVGMAAFTGGKAIALSPIPPVFMIFFAPGGLEMSQQSENTILQVVNILFSRPNARIAIIGHSDAAEASVPLSMSRAAAAKMRLLEMGVPPDRISVSARGDKDPLKETPPKTSEPQNRRVDFVLQ